MIELEVKKKQILKQCYCYALNWYQYSTIEKLAQKVSPRYYTKTTYGNNVYIIDKNDGITPNAITFGCYGNNFGHVVPDSIATKYEKKAQELYYNRKKYNFPNKQRIIAFFDKFIKEVNDYIDSQINNQ